jgi:hypothetical protein
VPQSVPFRNLTVERLVALNHGTISSPIPGQETAIASNKLRHLAAHVGELSLGSDPSNPSVSVRLSGVDTASILASADGVDNTAMRRTLVRQLLLSALGLPPDQLQTTYTFVWNGLRRDVTVVFGNVRDAANLPDTTFANDSSNWKLIVDFPFDDCPMGSSMIWNASTASARTVRRGPRCVGCHRSSHRPRWTSLVGLCGSTMCSPATSVSPRRRRC